MNEIKPITEALEELMNDVKALHHLRDCYVCLANGYQRARALSFEATRKEREFWKQVLEMYPELRGEKITHAVGAGVYIKESDIFTELNKEAE